MSMTERYRLDRYHLSQHHLGLVLVTGSAVAYSTAGFFTRLIPLDVWSLLFWRGVFAGTFMLVLLLLRRARSGQPIRLMGKSGWIIAGWSTLGMICFLNALRAAPVADVALIYATVPFVTAILAWLVVREKSAWRTIGASILALAGVVIMVGDGWSAGHWRGDLLAFGMTCAMAALTVCFRRYREIDTLQVAAASCLLGSLVALPFATIGGVDANQIGFLVLFGITQMGLGFLLLAAGTRRVSAMESALIGALDAPLAPLWVWLAFGETVSQATLVGGAIILLAVGADIALANRRAADMTAVTG